MVVGRARHTGHERAGLFTNRNTTDAKGIRDSPNPDSGWVKKVDVIAGRRTEASTGYETHIFMDVPLDTLTAVLSGSGHPVRGNKVIKVQIQEK